MNKRAALVRGKDLLLLSMRTMPYIPSLKTVCFIYAFYNGNPTSGSIDQVQISECPPEEVGGGASGSRDEPADVSGSGERCTLGVWPWNLIASI